MSMRAKWSTRLMLASYFTTIALGTMSLLDPQPMVWIIVAWLVIALGDFLLRPAARIIHWKEALILSAPILLMLVDLLRSPMDLHAWRLVERSSALVIFPIGSLILGAPSGATVRERLQQVFLLCTVIFACVVNIGIVENVEAGLQSSIPFDVAYRNAFAEFSGVHPPYAAYWFFTGALFGVDQLLTGRERAQTGASLWKWIFCLLICVLAGTFIGSRMPLFAFAVALIILLFRRLEQRRALGYALVTGLVVFGLGLLAPGISQRLEEVRGVGSGNGTSAPMNSVTVRAPVIHCSFSLLEKHWLLGAGQYDVQPKLDACYTELGHANMVNAGYGPHDQVMHWWLAFGLAGLGAFVLLFGWSMREAWRHQDHLHLAFLLFMLACSLTEDLLTRQWGVVLFAFFNTVFIASQRRGEHVL